MQVVLILGSFTEAGFAIKQAPEKGLTNVTYVVDGSAVNNAIIPIIGAENTKNVWGYFNAPYFPTQTDAPMASYRRIWTEKYGQPPHGPAQHLRPHRLRLHLCARPGDQEGRPRPHAGTR